MRRTLMLKNRELFDFEIDLASGKVSILDAPGPDDELLSSSGFSGSDRSILVEQVVRARCLSEFREDSAQILDAFGVRSVVELAFKGHGLSVIDMLWYRVPGSTERWEDINFFDNDWDSTYSTAILTGDYSSLASCSPDVPDLTTAGHLRKAWQRMEDGIYLLKEPLFESGIDLKGAILGADLCARLFGQENSQPLSVMEWRGRRVSASPLMVSRDEELIQGPRLLAIGGCSGRVAIGSSGDISPQGYIDILECTGVGDASAQGAKLFTFKDLALLADFHGGNIGVIRNLETGACRAAPPFDYDRSFGFPRADFPFAAFCNNPRLVALVCFGCFSDLESSWDWSWYDPHVLDGFENLIEEAYAGCSELPPNFAKLIAELFAMQRDYVNEVSQG